jgi:nucleoside permease NupC
LKKSFPTASNYKPAGKENRLGRLTGLLGLVVILSVAWLLSTNRKAIRWQTAAWGLGLQWVFAVLVLRFDAGERALAAAGDAVNRMLAYAFVGSGFVFGDLGKQHSSSLPSKSCPPLFLSPPFSLCCTTWASCRS